MVAARRSINLFWKGFGIARNRHVRSSGFVPNISISIQGHRIRFQFFERLWLGGEFSMRGFDIRRVGPTVAELDPSVDPDSYQGKMVMGGNKSLLFNGEFQIVIAQPVRIVFFLRCGPSSRFWSEFCAGSI